MKIIFCAMLSVLLSNQCNRPVASQQQQQDDNIETLRTLYKRFKMGEIERCILDGAVVYRGGLNAPDAGSVIFNKDGVKIGSCNYGWGPPDKLCHDLKNCEDIYRVANNIWGRPAVDKYGLGKE